jgi:putative PEP-CTERM system histidine kinase
MILSLLLPYASATCVAVLAILAAARRQRTIADWTFAAGMALLAVENVLIGLTDGAVTPDRVIHWQIWRILSLSLLPGTWLLFSLSYARGNAVEFLAKWKLSLAAAFAVPLLVAVFFRDDLLVAVPEGLGASRLIVRLGWSGFTLNLCMLIASVLVLMNLERTFRASVGTMRWRIKFMAMGVGILFIVRLYTSSQALLFRGIDPSFQIMNSGAALIGAILMLRSFFRSGRFNLNVYPSQFVLQGSLTVLLAGVYLIFIGLFSKLVGYFGGDSAFALKSFIGLVSLVLLAILIQSDRVRLSLRRFISRNFQRPLYDYRTMWQKFNEGTASRMERADLCRSLVGLVADMFEALSVTIWLMDEKGESLVLGASTSLSEAQSRDIGPQPQDSGEVIRHFQNHPEPADIEGSRSPWAASLRQWNPGEFPNGGHRICIPLIARGEMLGLITLGDRVGGVTYSLQDFDMLKCVGDHVAASLLNVRLSEKLLQAKELEAFQTMAAFFVHDLKNAASTLNLMLQNLPVHFADPAFREDALRGISKTVTHMNHLVGRLGLLRHEQKINPTPGDLNSVVASSLGIFENATGVNLLQNLRPLPAIAIDQEQMQKVVTNLVLNAREAVGSNGEVRVETAMENGWAVLTVADNGCGISPEFLRGALFRPFQTTKKSGLGIGMFQSKMIVEAHRGRIAVASEPGKGATFQVFLPTASQP